MEARLDPSRQRDQGDPDQDIREAGEPHYFHNCDNPIITCCLFAGQGEQVCKSVCKRKEDIACQNPGGGIRQSNSGKSISSEIHTCYNRYFISIIPLFPGCVASLQSRVKWQASVCASSFVHG